jgi:hypothetical protein
MRGISTVPDVALFLLLVSAAVATLTVPGSSPPAVDVDGAATTLGTATATVDYPVRLTVEHPNGSTTLLTDDRRANGTLANLLAAAAVANASFAGEYSPPDGHRGYDRTVENRTAAVLDGFADRLQVTAIWRPYRGADLRGSMRVGPSPPPTDVRVATVDVPGPGPAVRETARSAASGGFDTVATVVASATVRALYPRDRMRLAIQGGGLARGLAVRRYRRLADQLGTDLAPVLSSGLVRRANAELTAELADRFRRDMSRRFESPAAAARTVAVGHVRIVVRGWEG